MAKLRGDPGHSERLLVHFQGRPAGGTLGGHADTHIFVGGQTERGRASTDVTVTGREPYRGQRVEGDGGEAGRGGEGAFRNMRAVLAGGSGAHDSMTRSRFRGDAGRNAP